MTARRAALYSLIGFAITIVMCRTIGARPAEQQFDGLWLVWTVSTLLFFFAWPVLAFAIMGGIYNWLDARGWINHSGGPW
jgi:hypothetical protein